MNVRFSPPAERFLKKCKDKSLLEKFKIAFREIASDPNCGEPKRGDLAGLWGYDVFYNKTNYEIAYRVAEDTVIIVILIGTRENFYKELKAYIKS